MVASRRRRPNLSPWMRRELQRIKRFARERQVAVEAQEALDSADAERLLRWEQLERAVSRRLGRGAL